jgi:hypothetical protein
MNEELAQAESLEVLADKNGHLIIQSAQTIFSCSRVR